MNKYRIIYDSYGHSYPYILQRSEKVSYKWYKPTRIEWRFEGQFKTLEDAEKRIKELCTPPLEYDENGDRVL